ncbi:MAG: CvpA family protein [Candidatus Syntrophosphaera sp.]|nr:CvpA family protein [Candidatus Syntrophosphaera sp.]
MGVIDWIILAALLFTAALGFRRGLVGAILQICGTIATFFLAGHFYPLVRNSLVINFKLNNLLATIIAVVLIVVVVTVVIHIVIWLINRLIKAVNLTGLNKLLGFLFGLLNGLLAVMVVMIVLDYFPSLTTPLKDGSKHRVYVAVDTLKTDLLEKLKLTEHEKYHEILEKLRLEKEAENDNS